MEKKRTKLTRWEMETTINYNAEEQTATLYTRDKSVMRRLDKRVAEHPDVYKLIAETDIDKTYSFPKKLLSYRAPRILTEEQRAAIRERFGKTHDEEQDMEGDMDDEQDEPDIL